ncbi:BNR repeat-containing protein [Georgenia sp. 10Sc9-8]|uniref:BNR repeat-containing protein n=1 Tax=Georgenia halotolerans TaxID=3028317 RepID=A0ABT5TX44_9MICO|nr:BNR repeat-containing protein [Georgenia halotolerans]
MVGRPRQTARRGVLLLGAAALVVAGCTGADVPDEPQEGPGPLTCRTATETENAAEQVEAVLDTVQVDTTWAGHHVDQALLTDGADQYVGYYDADRELTVAHRTLGSAEWTYQRLGSRTGWDSHNYITLATDRDGHLHVAGNMHNDPLRYWRTTTPGDVSTLQRVENMVGPDLESAVTYPAFLEMADGTLAFRYREGGSGDGMDVFTRYDEDDRSWTGLLDTPLLDGEGERNAYATRPELGPDGDYHLAWVWRDSPTASATHTVSYARSPDLQHWETSTGEPLTLPITLETGDVVDPVEPGGGVINNNVQVGTDPDGEPVVAYHRYDDEGNTQVYVARPDDSESGWQNTQVTDWTGAWDFDRPGSLEFEVELFWAPETTEDGNLRLDVTCQDELHTVVIDSDSLAPLAETVTLHPEPAEVSRLRSDYQHPAAEGEAGTQMQVNLNDDSGGAGSLHERPLRLDPTADQRSLLRWESLGENQDRPRETWPDPQPLEVVVLGTEEACRDGGWRTFTGFTSEDQCVSDVRREGTIEGGP